MNAWIRNSLLATALGLSLLAIGPQPAQADDYWDGYWGWYDNTYRPYYYRQYARSPYYGGATYGGAYYGGYPSTAYYGGYPSGAYYGGYRGGAYYGTPSFGYSDFRGGAGAVRVGPMTFGWR